MELEVARWAGGAVRQIFVYHTWHLLSKHFTGGCYVQDLPCTLRWPVTPVLPHSHATTQPLALPRWESNIQGGHVHSLTAIVHRLQLRT